MAASGEPGDTEFTSEEQGLRSECDARFQGMPLVWAEAVRGQDGDIAGFLTFNGEMWRADALLFDGLCYTECRIGYYADQETAAQAVKDACKRPHDHLSSSAS